MPIYTSILAIGDQVLIDKQEDITAKVTAINFQHDGQVIYTSYQVEWLHNGSNHQNWIAGWRLQLVGGKNSAP